MIWALVIVLLVLVLIVVGPAAAAACVALAASDPASRELAGEETHGGGGDQILTGKRFSTRMPRKKAGGRDDISDIVAGRGEPREGRIRFSPEVLVQEIPRRNS